MERQAQEREQRKKAENDEATRRKLKAQCCGPLVEVGLERLQQAVVTLAALDGRSAQCALNGRFETKNLWIVKPSAKSRGRGIQTFRDVDKLLEYVGVAESGSQSSTLWVVQKYMENPLIIAKRKFDVRQWVLVTDWNPLTVYFYNECYARFSAAPYSDADSDLTNEHVHLVNNSVSKNNEQFHEKVFAENGDEIVDCMWSLEQLKTFMTHTAKQRGIFKGHDARAGLLEKQAKASEAGHAEAAKAYGAQLEGLPPIDPSQGEDVYGTRCHAHMREIAKDALLCAQGQVEHRKNSWELYGYDYMIDDDFVPWLIEINSSPACDYSTPTTEEFVPRALTDVVKVVVDLREWETKGGSGGGGGARNNNKGGVPKPEIGGWEPVYKGQVLDVQRTALGCDLACVGSGLMERNGRPKPGLKVNSQPQSQPVPRLYDDDDDDASSEAAASSSSHVAGKKGGLRGPSEVKSAAAAAAASATHKAGSATRKAVAVAKKKTRPATASSDEESDEDDETDEEDDAEEEDGDEEEEEAQQKTTAPAGRASVTRSVTTHTPAAASGKQAPSWSTTALVQRSPRLIEEEEEERGDLVRGTTTTAASAAAAGGTPAAAGTIAGDDAAMTTPTPKHATPDPLLPTAEHASQGEDAKTAIGDEAESAVAALEAPGVGVSDSIDFDDI
jgi:tubulin monoglycylase TTLL3/8